MLDMNNLGKSEPSANLSESHLLLQSAKMF